jgi:hypothetical protein
MKYRVLLITLTFVLLTTACGPAPVQAYVAPVPEPPKTPVAINTQVPYKEPGENKVYEVSTLAIPTAPSLPKGTPTPIAYGSIELQESGIPYNIQVWTFKKTPLQSAIPMALVIVGVQPQGPGEIVALIVLTVATVATVYYAIAVPAQSLTWQGKSWDTSHLQEVRAVYLATIYYLGYSAVTGCQHNNNSDGRGERTRIYWKVPKFTWGHGSADELTWIFNETQPTFSTVMPRNASALPGFNDLLITDPRCLNAFAFFLEYVKAVFGGKPPMAPAQ